MGNLFLSETLKMAGRSLLANRMRSLLALLGIVIGVGTVIGMIALINGFQRSFEQSIKSIGQNTIYIRRIRPGFQINGQIPDSLKQRRAFSTDDAAAILANGTAVRAIATFKFPTTTCASATATSSPSSRSSTAPTSNTCWCTAWTSPRAGSSRPRRWSAGPTWR
jgi:ABC-type lipoprotein release transport system permease subunit